MTFFVWLQHTGLAMWIVQSDSIWAYPSILTAHTFGLAVLVGASAVVALRLLGVAPGVAMEQLDYLYRFVWAGFYINLVSGVLLFVSEAADKAGQPIFIIKLALVIIALVVTIRMRREVFGNRASAVPSDRARRLASVSLVLWAGAITAGRLMAYVK